MSHTKKLLYIAVFSLITFAGASILDAATPRIAAASNRTSCPRTACSFGGSPHCYYSGGSSVCIDGIGGCETLGCS